MGLQTKVCVSVGVLLGQGCRTYGTRAQNDTREDFLATWHSLLPQIFVSFFRLASVYCSECVCVCVCMCDMGPISLRPVSMKYSRVVPPLLYTSSLLGA